MRVALVGASGPALTALADLAVDAEILVTEQEAAAARQKFTGKIHVLDYVTHPERAFHLLAQMDGLGGIFGFSEASLRAVALARAAVLQDRHAVHEYAVSVNKALMRAELDRAHVRQPAWSVIEPPAGGKPVIAKPVCGAGSVGVSLYQPGVSPTPPATEPMLYEEYIEGCEYSVESLLIDGRHYVLGVTSKEVGGETGFVERSHTTVPPDESPTGVVPYVRSVLRALGAHQGAWHTEVRVNDAGVWLIETHCRPGGDSIPLITEVVVGVDQYRASIASQVGRSMGLSTVQRAKLARSFFFFPGEVRNSGVLERLRGAEIPGLLTVISGKWNGEERVRSSRDRVGNAVVTGDSVADLDAAEARVREFLTHG